MNAYQAEAARVGAMSADAFDDEIYEKIIATIDLTALYTIEQELWTQLAMRDPKLEADDSDSIDRLSALSRATIDRLFVQVLADSRRYINYGPPSEEDAADCECCRMVREDYFKRS